MKKVFIVSGGTEHEGSRVVYVTDSFEKAQSWVYDNWTYEKYIDNIYHWKDNNNDGWFGHYDYFKIDEVSIDSYYGGRGKHVEPRK